jgi:hypothetical protein
MSEMQPESDPVEQAEPVEQVAQDSAETFPADAVRELRDELAKRRIRAKEQAAAANARLLTAYTRADGRLVEPDLLEMTEDLFDEDGFIDPERVTAAIDGLLQAKPYLSARKPTQPITQGVQPQVPDTPGLFTLIRDRI